MSGNFSLVSMFSGCGGMDLGFLGGFEYLGQEYARNPFDIVWANDINQYACKTYEYNLNHPILCGSVWDHFDTLPSQCDILVGGFPCQDISINGKRLGVAGARSGLYRAMVDAVEKCSPKIFIAENVRGLLYSYNKESLEKVISDFSRIGYRVSYELYKAVDFGIPQRRERVLIVGVKENLTPFRHLAPIFSKSEWVQSKYAISDLETMEIDEDSSHIWSLAQKSKDQGGRILNPLGPAHTIRAECHGNNQFHYSLPRRISMREAARFQSFPDNFKFKAKLRETERMIGNAVPPVLAWHVARRVRETLSEISSSEKVGIAAE